MSYTIHHSAELESYATVGDGSSIWQLAHIRTGATIGQECVIGRGAFIDEHVRVGDRVKIQNYSLVYAPAILEDEVFIGPAVVLTNDKYPRAANPNGTKKSAADWEPVGVTVRRGASIGARSVCVAPVVIGEFAVVGAGSVVVHDVPSFALVVGNPARRIGWVGTDGRPLTHSGDELWTSQTTGERFRERDQRLEKLP